MSNHFAADQPPTGVSQPFAPVHQSGAALRSSSATGYQEHLALWRSAGGKPSRPDDFAPPQYIYGWGSSDHVSGKMGRPDWYERHSLNGKLIPTVKEIEPRMDLQAYGVLEFVSSTAAAA